MEHLYPTWELILSEELKQVKRIHLLVFETGYDISLTED